jgi:hypothetical protein
MKPVNSVVLSPYRSQASAFESVPQRSLQMALCLNGCVPVRAMAQSERPQEWLAAYLHEHFPQAAPGATGPITIVLVL